MNALNLNLVAAKQGDKALVGRWVEWLVLFVGVPLALRIWWQPLVLLAILVAVTAWGVWWLVRRRLPHYQPLWRGPVGRNERRQFERILWRFAVSAILLLAVVGFFTPGKLFNMPRTQPMLWLSVLVSYPLLSVYPQEVIYRALFFNRYRPLFRGAYATLLASAGSFAFMHLVFQNWPAVLLTLIGGWLFAETYARTYSLRLVWLEHTLYGILIFTIGLGDYFYHANVGQALGGT
ncbi:CPBP family glutamic-type intramembrane protease [Hymenobacter tibetensis]|uniref:CPBP family glutamic-type intramembrane protease n=1 Tax=Hymenobacter tibetensis TaxID=497967 RepID=A0ABY4D3T9_9BACT|nr:CPBP family intramembrane glutamic endopeptidase [Hymenobacter tibetensis]UOG76692.1 CPBP family glutamic-type intramembrane protease [Hymenobacter tibetensis]